MLLKLEQFGGYLPLRNLRNTPDANATYAENMRLDQGGLRAANPPTQLTTRSLGLDAAGKGIRRVYGVIRDKLQRPDLSTNMYYLGFGDPDTDVVRTPFINDRYDRHYFCSPSTGLQFVTRDMITAYNTAVDPITGNPGSLLYGPIKGLKVGVQPPPVEPKFKALEDTTTGDLVWIDAGDTPIPHQAGELVTDPQYRFYKDANGLSLTQYRNTPVTRTYTLTYVNIYGEESQPGAVVEVDVAADQAVDLSELPVPANVAGYAAYDKKRIYRTIVQADGAAPYFRVADIAIADTTYRDTLRDIDIAGSDVIESLAWTPPPDGLQGIIGMPTGYMVGWIGKDLFFSEAYRPHAWPDKYVITVEHEIVGLGITGGTLVVLTAGRPVLINGATPSLVQQDATAQTLPCLSRGSIVSTPSGVIYASDNGYLMFGPGGLQRFTDQVIGPEAWRRDFIPQSIRSIVLPDGSLVFSHTDATGLLQFDAIRPDAPALGLVRHVLSVIYSPVLFTEVNTGRAIIIRDGGQPGSNNGRLFELLPAYSTAEQYFLWRSKEFQLPAYTNFGAVRIDWSGDIPIAFTLWGIVRNGDVEEKVNLFEWGFGVFKVPGQPVRLPTGCRYDTFQVEVSGTGTVFKVTLASTIAELRNV